MKTKSNIERILESGGFVVTSECGPPRGSDPEVIRKQVTEALAISGTRQVKTMLAGLPLPERLAKRVTELAGIQPDLPCSQLTKKARQAIIALLSGFPFPVLRLGGFGEAMVTRGGVALSEIDPKTMESRLVPRLYCIGEVLDIDGDTGGYNLQAAFSTLTNVDRNILQFRMDFKGIYWG